MTSTSTLTYPPGLYSLEDNDPPSENNYSVTASADNISFNYKPSIELSPSLNALQEPVKQELRKVFAIHSNVRTKYAIAALLYDEAKRVAQSYEQRRNDALAELNDLTVHVDRCVYLALNGEPSSSKEFEEHAAPNVESSADSARNGCNVHTVASH